MESPALHSCAWQLWTHISTRHSCHTQASLLNCPWPLPFKPTPTPCLARSTSSSCPSPPHILLGRSWNALRGESARVLEVSLEGNAGLRHISLANNGFGDADGARIIKGLLKHGGDAATSC